MNYKPIKIAQKALESVMNAVPSTHGIGERIFLSMQIHHMRASIDAQDDALRIEYRDLVRKLAREEDPEARKALLNEIKDVERQRDKLEALDDTLHAKDHNYKKAITALYNKAYDMLKSACSSLDSLIEFLTSYFKKSEAI